MFSIHSHERSIVTIFFAAAVSLVFSAVAAAGTPCDDALPLDLPVQWRGYESGRDAWFRFETFSPGLVVIAVTSPLSEVGEPWLEVWGSGCRPLAGTTILLERRVAQQILAVREPGEYFVRVAATDPTVLLGSFRLTLALDASGESRAVNPLDDEPDPDPLHDRPSRAVDPLDAEPDPDPFHGRPSRAVDPLDAEPDPDPFHGRPSRAVDPLDAEPDPDPLTQPACRSVAVDDHGDLPACASSVILSRPTGGEIRNAWLDDVDYFEFVLGRLQTVEILTRGTSDTVGGLLDRSGNLLTEAEDGGEGENFRIIKALPPGRYAVRVEGSRGSEGSYQLIVRGLK